MSDHEERMTWDGKPVSSDPPFGATVVVYRCQGNEKNLELLILHRSFYGRDYEGDWAWTPPSGARYPGERIDDCAQRELREETGLELIPQKTIYGTEAWFVYTVEADLEATIKLGDEHDRYTWVPIEEAVKRCSPEQVKRPLRLVAETFEGC